MPRYDPDRLRLLAGDAVFQRGEAYAADGAVTLLGETAGHLVAIVRGSEAYRVRLQGSGTRFGGDCTCPAHERDGWCKHLVAAALTANATPIEVPDYRTPIRAHLLSLGAEALADMLLDMAERDPTLLRRLELAASAARAPVREHAARLRQALGEALRSASDLEDDTEMWLDEILDILEQVPPLIAGGAASEAKDLVESVLDDLPGVLETLHEAGDGFDVLDRALAVHLEACRVLRPDPLILAAELFERAWDEDAFGTFAAAEERYAELLGETGLAEYRRLAEAAHGRLPPIGRDGKDPRFSDRLRLTEILDRFAARAGDIDRRIALRRAALAHAHDHLALARFCMEQGREETALQVAEDAAWLFDDTSGTSLVEFLAERLVSAGRKDDAVAALWRGFERVPAFSLFQALRALGVSDAAERALRVVRTRRDAAGKTDRWRIAASVELEIGILMAAARLEEAWRAAWRHDLPDTLMLRLARESEASLPAEACRGYRHVVGRQIALTDRRGYEEAVRLLGRLARLEPAEAHLAFVAELRGQHRAKRSLVPMLDAHVASMRKT
jgi:uncharacterized Zn finger protein